MKSEEEKWYYVPGFYKLPVVKVVGEEITCDPCRLFNRHEWKCWLTAYYSQGGHAQSRMEFLKVQTGRQIVFVKRTGGDGCFGGICVDTGMICKTQLDMFDFEHLGLVEWPN